MPKKGDRASKHRVPLHLVSTKFDKFGERSEKSGQYKPQCTDCKKVDHEARSYLLSTVQAKEKQDARFEANFDSANAAFVKGHDGSSGVRDGSGGSSSVDCKTELLRAEMLKVLQLFLHWLQSSLQESPASGKL